MKFTIAAAIALQAASTLSTPALNFQAELNFTGVDAADSYVVFAQTNAPNTFFIDHPNVSVSKISLLGEVICTVFGSEGSSTTLAGDSTADVGPPQPQTDAGVQIHNDTDPINSTTTNVDQGPIDWSAGNSTSNVSSALTFDPTKLYCDSKDLQPAQPAYFGEPELWQCYIPVTLPSRSAFSPTNTLVIQMKFQNKRPVVPATVNLGELMLAVINGTTTLSERIANESNIYMPLSSNSSAPLITPFAYGNTAIYLETSPCYGHIALGPFLESSMEVPRYSDVALWLQAVVQLIVGKASVQLDVGSGQIFWYAGRWEPYPIDYRLRRHLGLFNVQTVSTGFSPLSRVFGYQYKCDLGGGGGEGDGTVQTS
ncbi:uncharacterized protein KY384_000769 [Bacidia gigantensis]|uniref:uncharacterized protein n=1 Tax=Bacidia gigantensis TaxID=2732470 RepID=UPI001D05A0C2|nr:uncharacterized protein KY384_000769 [Bacidia gigantensis]KAG8526007.1 hypothetical protein KY384_000769 [Bacidia gigantensis]